MDSIFRVGLFKCNDQWLGAAMMAIIGVQISRGYLEGGAFFYLACFDAL
ncbi:hypothetical protein ACT691_19695 [Vibrio metschnikovii]